MKNLQKSAVIYVRTATIDQTHTSNSVDTQINGCTKYALENNIDIVKVFLDIGRSVKNNTKSEQFEELLQFATTKSNEIDLVLVYQFDRWTRNVEQGLAAKAYLAKYGVELISATQTISPSPTGKFINVVLMAAAELDSTVKSKRVKDAMTEKYKSGDWMWAAPFGYTRTKKVVESEVKPKQEESELVQKIFSMAAEGISVEKITKHFTESDGLPKDVASPIAVERIISNPFYKGYMKSSLVPELVKGNYSPLVTVSLWEQANNNIRN